MKHLTFYKLCFCATLLLTTSAVYAIGQGEILTTSLNHSIRYPGTQRTINVYVPQGYHDDQPACMLVRLDGLGTAVPQALDSLIQTGEMPMTICVNILPGQVKDSLGNVLRYNRSNEFDRMSPTFAEFIEYEVLPLVQTLKTSDGRAIRLSSNPNDRAITGLSSSGIAAFTAAWFHPDFYSKVYSIVGTFVPMRGGDTYPGLIRKYEPKPIRIYLQDNDQDTWNLNLGSWFEYNQLMASALEYAQYDLLKVWNPGGHNGKNGENQMVDALRWLFRDWPQPIEHTISGNKQVTSVVQTGEKWQPTEKLQGVSSTQAIYPGGVFIARGKPYSACVCTWIMADGEEQFGEEFYWLHSDGVGWEQLPYLAFDTLGWLYVATPMGIQICDHNGRVRAILDIPYPNTPIEDFTFVENTLYLRQNGLNFARKIQRTASTAATPLPKSQGEG